jgi:hypothetical protein
VGSTLSYYQCWIVGRLETQMRLLKQQESEDSKDKSNSSIGRGSRLRHILLHKLSQSETRTSTANIILIAGDLASAHSVMRTPSLKYAFRGAVASLVAGFVLVVIAMNLLTNHDVVSV